MSASTDRTRGALRAHSGRRVRPWLVARRWLAALGVLAVLLLSAARGAAHDLAVDELRLWIDRESGGLRGQLTLDPELTRSLGAGPASDIQARLVELVQREVRVEVDGRERALVFEVRELWVRGGATAGDLVMLTAPALGGCHTLRVFAGAPFKALAVSVEAPSGDGNTRLQSWLLVGGSWTPPYRCEPELESGWREGGPESLLPELEQRKATAQGAGGGQGAGEARWQAEGQGSVSRWRTAWDFLRLGFLHIVPEGLDHMLFVAGLVLGRAGRARRVLLELSLFTLAHTTTLALSSLELVRLPGQIVEPLIALSIAYVGFENLLGNRREGWRALVVFAFGLVHGLGFATALGGARESERFFTALVSFNLGVELGQIAVVLPLFLGLMLLAPHAIVQRYVIRGGSLAISLAGVYWAVERAFWAG